MSTKFGIPKRKIDIKLGDENGNIGCVMTP